jgi:hypothetical protein
MKNDKIVHYCKQVGQRILCGKEHRKALLAGLKDELLERELPDTISMKGLYEQIGTPEVVAAQLQASLEPGEIRTEQKRRKRRHVVAAAITFAVLCVAFALAVHFINSHEPKFVKTYIIYGDDYDDPNTTWYSTEQKP